MEKVNSYPSPNGYLDWRSWAAVLVSQLQQNENRDNINIPIYIISPEKKRNGFPPAAKGDLIWIKENGIRKLAIYDGENWIRYSPEG